MGSSCCRRRAAARRRRSTAGCSRPTACSRTSPRRSTRPRWRSASFARSRAWRASCFPGFPRSGKTARQLQVSSGLFFDVLQRYDPTNLLLSQAAREVLERQLESTRLGETLRAASRARRWSSPSRSGRRRSPFRWSSTGTREQGVVRDSSAIASGACSSRWSARRDERDRRRDRVRSPASSSLLLASARCTGSGARTLLVADPHFGKAAAFRAAGVSRAARDDAAKRSRVWTPRSRARRAGESFFSATFFMRARGERRRHCARSASGARACGDRDAARARQSRQRAGDPPRELEIACVERAGHRSAIRVCSSSGAVGRRLRARRPRASGARAYRVPGRQRERLPCFWFGREIAVLPAFGEFTGLADIEVTPGDQVWVVADGEVIAVREGRVTLRAVDERATASGGT